MHPYQLTQQSTQEDEYVKAGRATQKEKDWQILLNQNKRKSK
jgi:hypothetical protein